MKDHDCVGNRNINTVKVSVILITHNRCSMLQDAIRSVLNCHMNNKIELVLVDNGSDDDTVTMIQEIFPQVKLIQSSYNMGVSWARNLGVENASGDFAVFIDDDATIDTPDIFSTVIDRFNKYPNVSVIAFRIVNESTNTVLRHEFPMRVFKPEDTMNERFVSYFPGCGFAARRRDFLSLGGFFSEMFYGPEEVDYAYRVFENGMDILYCPDVVIRHRTHPVVRRKRIWYYNSIRSRILMALRNLPLWAMIPFLIIWHLQLFRKSLRAGDLKHFLHGSLDGWRDCHIAWAKRKVIGRDTISRIQKLSGRLFC